MRLVVGNKFILGFCNCPCREWIPIRNKKRKLAKYKHGHNIAGFGTGNIRWNNGCMLNSGGYRDIRVVDHPFASVRGYVMEHRLVWEKHNNAILLPWADVHHINKNILDNRIENLQAMMHGQHMAHHNALKKRDACGRFQRTEVPYTI